MSITRFDLQCAMRARVPATAFVIVAVVAVGIVVALLRNERASKDIAPSANSYLS